MKFLFIFEWNEELGHFRSSIRKYVGALKCIWPAEDYGNEAECGKTR